MRELTQKEFRLKKIKELVIDRSMVECWTFDDGILRVSPEYSMAAHELLNFQTAISAPGNEFILKHEKDIEDTLTAAASPEERAKRKDKKHGLMIERLIMKYQSELNEKVIVYSDRLNELSDAEIEKEYKMHFGELQHG